MNKVPREIEEFLQALDVPWELKFGSKHIKILIDGQLGGVLPRNGRCDRDRRSTLNILSQMRRVVSGGSGRRG